MKFQEQKEKEEKGLEMGEDLEEKEEKGKGSEMGEDLEECKGARKAAKVRPKKIFGLQEEAKETSSRKSVSPSSSELVTDTAVGSNRDEKASAVKSSPLEKVENLGGGATEMRGGATCSKVSSSLIGSLSSI